MKKNKINLLRVNHLLFVMGIILLSSCSFSKKNIVQSKINWKSFSAQQDPVWDTLNAYFYDGPMTGNGLIGSVLHRMDKTRFKNIGAEARIKLMSGEEQVKQR